MNNMNNILLVEDDYLDAMNVQRQLSKANISHSIKIARNGKEALSFLQGQESERMNPMPDIILLDINMPKMNGLEFLKEIRSDSELKHMKVFIMTTSNEETERTQAQRLGIDGFIIKPLSFDDFDNKRSSMDSFNLLCDLLKN
ncbi:MAG: response regulator [Sphingobacteriales bacterium]|nr:MAG: response regulator [Sphingobacteriales bacterium]